MKKIIIVIFLAALFANVDVKAQCNEQLVRKCALDIGDNATYLKEFKVLLRKRKRRKSTPSRSFSVVLNRGTHYRFNLCNAEDYEGRAVMMLYDADRLLVTTFDMATTKEYPSVDFICTKSAVYKLYVSFKEGKEGCAVVILSMVR